MPPLPYSVAFGKQNCLSKRELQTLLLRVCLLCQGSDGREFVREGFFVPSCSGPIARVTLLFLRLRAVVVLIY